MDPAHPSSSAGRVGVAYGLAAYTWWGVVVVYFKAVSHVPSLEVLAHRIVWALLLLSALLAARHRWPLVLAAVRTRRTMLTLTATAILVAINWLTFIWAVSHARVVQASLGYFTNPLVNVLLGFVFLRERLRPAQWVSVALAAVGVSYLTVALGEVPWIALTLAFSFGFYGLLRKVAAVGPLEGLTIETLVLLPIAGSYLVYLGVTGDLVFGHRDLRTDALLVAAGAVTALPLLWFSNAARRLRLATIGFLQYLAPSLQLMLGVLLYDEPFRRHHQITFAFIWTALAIYSVETFRARPRRR